MGLQEVEGGFVDWIDLAQYTDRKRAVVNAVMNYGFHDQPRGLVVKASDY